MWKAFPGPLVLETWSKCCARSKNQKPTAAEKAEIRDQLIRPKLSPGRTGNFRLKPISGNQLQVPLVRGSFLKQPWMAIKSSTRWQQFGLFSNHTEIVAIGADRTHLFSFPRGLLRCSPINKPGQDPAIENDMGLPDITST